jgi:hypothetical protein
MKLLLACCRTIPDSDEIALFTRNISDWTGFPQIAQHNLVLPLAFRQLKKHSGQLTPEPVLKELAERARQAELTSLLHQAELQQIASKYLHPAGVDYLLLKGLSIAGRYYHRAGERQSRDIDLLIDPARFHELTSTLLEGGYRLNAEDHVSDARSLRAFCSLNAEINLISPRGVPIQLHQLLDFTGCQYPVSAQSHLGLATKMQLNGAEYPVMTTTELFVYAAYHHGRHQWSRLHWVSDIEHICQSSDFDKGAVLARAAELGMSPVVEAALAVHHRLLGTQAGASSEPPRSAFVLRTIENCLRYLDEKASSPERERDLRRQSGPGIVLAWLEGFRFNWEANSRLKNRCRYILSVFKATFADFLFLPLPQSMFWVYPAIRPVRWTCEILRGRQTGKGRAST